MEDRPNDPWSPPPAEPYGGTPPPPPVPPSAAVIPWEDPAVPWPTAFLTTIAAFFAGPRAAFARVPVKGDVLRPLVFAILVGWIGQFVYGVWEITLGDALYRWIPGYPGSEELPRGSYFAIMALAPLFTAIGLVLSSSITHVCLLLFGGARNGFAATFRALCYVQVATLVLMIPFCGTFIAGFVALVFEVIGISEMHRIGLGKAAAAVLLPVLLCCVCLGIAFMLAGAAFMSALGGAGALK